MKIETEEYKVLQCRGGESELLVFEKIIRLADDVIYELNVTDTQYGRFIHSYCEENNYRKLVLVFMGDTNGNKHFKLSDAPLPTKFEKFVYWASNDKPPQVFFDKSNIMLGEKAREYHTQIKEWNHELFVYDSTSNTFSNKNNKVITDFKYLFKM